MLIGDRLRCLREEKKLSQGDLQKRTGLTRGYISRVENGHIVPAIENLEKMTRAMDVPLYQLFYDGGEEPPKAPLLSQNAKATPTLHGGIQARMPVFLTGSAGFWVEWMRRTPSSSSWRLNRWRPNGRKPSRVVSLT